MPTNINGSSQVSFVEPCFGTMCPHHCTCARYAAVDGSSDVKRGTCIDSNGLRPMFIPIVSDKQMRLF